MGKGETIKNLLNLVKLSIIIPVKNRAHIIEQTINSILSTNYPDLEIIVIDNNSKDEIEKIIKSYKNIIFVKNNQDKERSFSRNLGIKLSTGKFITFLDSDDLLKKEIFHSFIQAFKIYNNDKFFFTNFDYIENNLIKTNYNPFKKEFCKIDDLVKSNLISNIGIFIDRELALDNIWDENKNIIGTEDYDFVLRLMIKVKRAVLIKKSTLALVRLHDGRSVFNDKKFKILKRYFYFKKKIFNNNEFKNLKLTFKKKILSTQSLYASLLLINCGERKKSFKFLLQSIRYNLFSIYSKRFIYILIKLIFKK